MKVNKRYLLFIIFFSSLNIFSANDSTIIETEIENETIIINQFDDSSYKANYRKDEEFDYTEKVKKPIKKTVKPKKNHSFLEDLIMTIAKFSDFIVYIVVGLVIIFLLYFFKDFFLQFSFSFKSASIEIKEEKEYQNIFDLNLVQNENNLKDKLKQFIEQKNFKEAIRYYFLYYLKTLQDKKVIQFNLDKTNEDYKKEIENEKEIIDFERLSRIFEYFWYGNVTIEEEDFKKYEMHFLNKFKI
jgi:hypothetical protein